MKVCSLRREDSKLSHCGTFLAHISRQYVCICNLVYMLAAATKPVLMASQTTPSSQVVPVNKQTLLTKSLHARASTGQCNQQTQSIGMTTLSQHQVRISYCINSELSRVNLLFVG